MLLGMKGGKGPKERPEQYFRRAIEHARLDSVEAQVALIRAIPQLDYEAKLHAWKAIDRAALRGEAWLALAELLRHKEPDRSQRLQPAEACQGSAAPGVPPHDSVAGRTARTRQLAYLGDSEVDLHDRIG